jgi:hypothetical protein
MRSRRFLDKSRLFFVLLEAKVGQKKEPRLITSSPFIGNVTFWNGLP